MLQIEQLLLANRARLFYAVKEYFLQLQKARFPESVVCFPDFENESVKFWKAVPTRHTIEGVLLQRFWHREPTYSHLMSQTSLSSDRWLSCDHTFKAVCNIGSVRSMDNKWVTQYTGLFCILNSAGKVLTWKMTKAMSFEHIEDVLIALQRRLWKQGQQVKEFYIDNCCSLRSKLQGVFGSDLKVYLDIFHAIQRISQKMPKRHPYYYVCLHGLRMVFRDPADHGDIRTKSTPSPEIIHQQLLHFQSQWEGMKYKERLILPPAAIKEIKCLLVHVDRGCLSGISPGRGTNRNERLHRDINTHMTSTRYGVELSYALLTKIFFRHNEHIDAREEKRTPRPITAFGFSEKQTGQRFGLSTPAETPSDSIQLATCPSKIEMRKLSLSEVLDELNKMTVQNADLAEEQVSCIDFNKEEALLVLKQAVSAFYVSTYLEKMTDTAKLNAGTFFISFIAVIEKLVASCPHDSCKSQIDKTLSSWNLKRVDIPGDGNCLFTSTAFSLVQLIQGGDAGIKAHMLLLGVPEMNLEDVEFLCKFLRLKMVEEWSNNLDFYQGFITNDLSSMSQHFLQDGYFSGDAGDLMVLTLANILLIPVTIFTSIENMPVLCVLPTSGPTVSSQPIFLAYNQDGPGHYDCATQCVSTKASESKTSVITKCSCGRKPNHKVLPCTNLRCNCYRSKVKCTSACICKACANEFGVRPLPCHKRRRQVYDNQRQPLKGRSTNDFLTEMDETQTDGSFTLLESLILKMIITHFILQGFDVSANSVLQAFKKIQCLCDTCHSVEFPLLKRSIRNIERYLSKLFSTIELLKLLVKFSH